VPRTSTSSRPTGTGACPRGSDMAGSHPNWEVVIGLETHAQLSTRSKIFSSASTAFGAEPNSQASVVDLALPGVLPVLNRGAVERAIRFGLAVGATISPRSVFARKNYFYPTSRRATRSASTSCRSSSGGTVRIAGRRRREDGPADARPPRGGRRQVAPRGLPRHERHRPQPRRHAAAGDRDRAGHAPPQEAVAYAKALHALVQWIGICDGNMQEGSFRCDANVSVRPMGGRQARHALRDQEPQLLPLPRTGHRARGRAARSS
jgi:aspartyl-tRNA(Asn)/glutamyl-tRNA(Gln) amidotransferase subunit B